uniref:Uncharacterized protein n=1 Tax=Tanacetum cinerariifolium TaxID=118510 RepID=A0A6L2L8J8_TANCI|nr:hypothetical protein [Tanacetum cinerariifolium]
MKAAITSKKKSSIFTDDNIILKPDVTLELGKSISRTEAKPYTRGSSKGAGVTPEVLDESTCIFTTSSEGTGIKSWVPNKVKGSFEAKVDFAINWGSKNESDYFKEDTIDKEIEWVSNDEEEEKQDDQEDDDDRIIDIEEATDDVKTNDEFMHDDMDEEMKGAEDDETGKEDEEITDAEKTEAIKGDYQQARKLPPTSSSLSVSFGFDDMDQAAVTADLSIKVKKKHNDQEEDHTAGLDQGKDKKRP